MNIGIFTYRHSPYISANTSIGYELGVGLKNTYKHSITFIGFKQSQDNEDSFCDIPIKYINDKFDVDSHGKVINKFFSIIGEENKYYQEAKKLKRVIAESKIDLLVVIIAPNQNMLVTKKAKLDIPVILYQLDPYYNLNMIVNNHKKKEFINFVKKTLCTFTTEELYTDYISDVELKKYKSKIVPVGFPKIRNNYLANDFDSIENRNEKIVFSYVGSLYNQIRSPQILIDFSKILNEDSMIEFLGSADCSLDDIKNEKKIEFKGFCSSEVATNFMLSSDFLINIGNSVTNQLGSKLIDYISTGKPIINIYQSNKCPTLRVLDKYPAKINIYFEDLKNNSEMVKKQLFKFIDSYRGYNIPFCDIKNTYYKYTSDYVCKLLNEKIKNGSENCGNF